MKTFLTITLLFFSFVNFAIADTYVKGYTKSNGTVVEGYYRSSPDSSVNNNFSTKGNVNPYTGKEGNVSREYSNSGYSSNSSIYYSEGDYVEVCGTLAKISSFKKGVYLNIDKPFPYEKITFVIWNKNLKDFNNYKNLINREICGSGKIRKYKGHDQISLYKSSSLRVK